MFGIPFVVASFEVLTAVRTKTKFFWDITPYRLVKC